MTSLLITKLYLIRSFLRDSSSLCEVNSVIPDGDAGIRLSKAIVFDPGFSAELLSVT